MKKDRQWFFFLVKFIFFQEKQQVATCINQFYTNPNRTSILNIIGFPVVRDKHGCEEYIDVGG